MLTRHLQENPIIERSQSSQVTNDMEREELRIALIAAQESAAVQILLEAGLTDAETNIREVKLICAYLHETFINDPNLAKLVHFQVSPALYIFIFECRIFNSFYFIIMPVYYSFSELSSGAFANYCQRSSLYAYLSRFRP